MINESFHSGHCPCFLKVDAKTDSEVICTIGEPNGYGTDRGVKAKGFTLFAEGAMRNEISDLPSDNKKFIVELL